VGVEIPKIHQVLEYKQDYYMMEYVNIIAKWRAESTCNFSSSLYKSLGNLVVGKLKENLTDRKKIEIVYTEKRLQKLVRKGSFKERHIFNYGKHEMVLVENSIPVVYQNRPIIVAGFVWSISKVVLYSTFYNVLRPAFGPQLYVDMCDTDSYLLSVPCSYDKYLEILRSISHIFDFSNLKRTHKLFDDKNRRVLGLLKMECGGERIVESCCVKSKVYSLRFESSRDLNKCKGVNKHFVRNKLTFDDFKNCVFKDEKRFALYKSIISQEHNIYTTQVSKQALDNIDLKRHLLPDKINTLGHYHYKIK
jgi:hypothetical protein